MPPHYTSLAKVLSDLPPHLMVSAVPDVDISGIAIDSRRVAPGDLFVALRGGSTDGHAHIAEAVENGAAAVAGERQPKAGTPPYVQLRNTREALSWIAAAFYGWPARSLLVFGVTGTDGKTTTCNLIHSILKEAGIRAGAHIHGERRDWKR